MFVCIIKLHGIYTGMSVISNSEASHNVKFQKINKLGTFVYEHFLYYAFRISSLFNHFRIRKLFSNESNDKGTLNTLNEIIKSDKMFFLYFTNFNFLAINMKQQSK